MKGIFFLSLSILLRCIFDSGKRSWANAKLIECSTPKDRTINLIVTNRTEIEYLTTCYDKTYAVINKAVEDLEYYFVSLPDRYDYYNLILDKNMNHKFPEEQSFNLATKAIFFKIMAFDPDNNVDKFSNARATVIFRVFSLKTLDIYSGNIEFFNLDLFFYSDKRAENSSFDLEIVNLFNCNSTIINVSVAIMFLNRSKRKFSVFYTQNTNLTVNSLEISNRFS